MNNIKLNKIVITTISILSWILLSCFLYYYKFKKTYGNTLSIKCTLFTQQAIIPTIWALTIATIITILALIILFSKIDKFKIFKFLYSDKVYITVLLIVGITFSVLFPMFQTPDEGTHIGMIYTDLGISNTGQGQYDTTFTELTKDFGNYNIQLHYDRKVKIDEYFNFNNELKLPENKTIIPKISILKHLPQALGLLMCSSLHLPILLSVIICESFAVIFYVLLCYFSLKLLPFKKSIMKFIMILPICVQQMGTMSYDAVIMPLCYFFISYILYLKFKKKEIRTPDLIILLTTIAWITLIKVPYGLLILLILLLPSKKLNINLIFTTINGNTIKENQKFIIIILSIALPIIILLGFSLFSNNENIKIIIASILELPATIKLLVISIVHEFAFNINTMISALAWNDLLISPLFTMMVIGSGVYFIFIYNKSSYISKMNLKTKIFLILLFIVILISIFIALIGWTIQCQISNSQNSGLTPWDVKTAEMSIEELRYWINEIPFIYGTWGRYFVPILPLLLFPITSLKINNVVMKTNYKTYTILYYFTMIIFLFFSVLNRYWVC